MEFESRIRDLLPDLERVYTDIHAHPELSMLRTDLYALAALAGAAVVVGGHFAHWPPTATTVAGAILCFTIRLLAIRRGWSLPPARLPLSSS